MRKVIILIVVLNSSIIYSQLLEENFDYGSTETDLVSASSSAWSNHSGGTGTSDVQYLSTGLSYTDYPSSGVGGAVSISNSKTGDDDRSFSPQSSGSIYLSALVNVASATTTAAGEYILHYGAGSTSQYCRLYIRNESGNLRFGISKFSEGAIFSSTNYSFNTTYLVVLKYTFNGSAQDDRVDLWVISSGVPATENDAGTATVSNVTAANDDASSISAVSVRQGTVAHSAQVDGIRVATSWSEAPLPVELTLFTANVTGGKVELNWETATEINNYGFSVERRVKNEEWNQIGFVHGFGNSNSTKYYSFVDQSPLYGELQYRLKQIDFDGGYEYSEVINVVINSDAQFLLDQNFPNPFNPATTIEYVIPNVETTRRVVFTTLKVYDILGREVATLVNEYKSPGKYSVHFNVETRRSESLPSGIYFYTLRAWDPSLLRSTEFQITKKMILIR